MPAPPRAPIFLLTGFLGSGKTTLLRHLLDQPALADTAVLINEFGEVGLDHLLVRQVTDDVVLLASGCVCCTVREDLAAQLDELADLRDAGRIPPFSRVAIETTGLADPAPVAQLLLGDAGVASRFFLAGIIATVDAVNGLATLDAHPEPVRQAAMADRIVLTKSDIADADALARLEARLARLNPGAPRLRSAPGSEPPPAALFDARAYDVAALPAEAHGWMREDSHGSHHDERIASFVLAPRGPVDWEAFRDWLELLLSARGEQVLRVKGLLEVRGRNGPVVVQGVQHLLYPAEQLPSWPGGRRGTRLVFITMDLPEAGLAASLDELATAQD